jgi:hypothetical protein
MGVLLGLLIGYIIGARAGSKDLDQVVESLRALRASDEFSDLASAARSHLGHTFRELANTLDGAGGQVDTEALEGDDIVDRVMHLHRRD